jgi:hypothetical protein
MIRKDCNKLDCTEAKLEKVSLYYRACALLVKQWTRNATACVLELYCH